MRETSIQMMRRGLISDLLQGWNWRVLLVMLLLVMTFRPFDFVPGMAMLKQAWIVITFLFTVTLYPIWVASRKRRISTFELYTISLLVLVPVVSAISARSEFGQPLLYGLLAQRSIVLCAIALIVLFLFRKRLLNECHVEKAVLFLAWFTLVLFSLFSIVADPSQYAGEQFVAGENTGNVIFKFNVYLMIIGFCYYFYLAYRFNSSRDYFYALLFLAFLIIVDGGRALLLSLLLSVAFFSVKWGSIMRIVRLLPMISAGVIVLFTAIYLADSQAIVKIYSHFGGAFAVVTTGEKGEDVSANARIAETLISIPYIEKNWLLGNGDISNQWHGGYIEVLGGYFYPSDIGLIGVVYMYGLAGALLFAFQFLFALRFLKYKTHDNSPLVNAIKAFLLYFAIHSIFNGRYVHLAEISFLLISLLCVIGRAEHKNRLLKGGGNGVA